MDRSLSYIRNTWEKRAKEDALHAVLTTNDESVFWPRGEQEIGGLEREGLISPQQHVLDYGCGIGRLTIPLSERVARVVSADVSPEMLRHLEQGIAGRNNIQPLLVAPGGPIGGKYDLIISFLVLQHMPPFLVRWTLKRFREALNPGGRIAIDLPIVEWEKERDFRNQLWARTPLNELWESRYYRESEFEDLLIKPAGLKIERILGNVRDRPILILTESDSSVVSRSRSSLLAWYNEIDGVMRNTPRKRWFPRGLYFAATIARTKMEELVGRGRAFIRPRAARF